MRKVIFILAITTFIAGTTLFGCQSSTEKEEDAQLNRQDAKQDLEEVQHDINEAEQKAENAEEWETFKSETEIKIIDNEIRIAALKIKLKKSGKPFDPVEATKIDGLEQKNNDVKIMIAAYENNRTDWELFKSDFNHEMDELGQALKDFTVHKK